MNNNLKSWIIAALSIAVLVLIYLLYSKPDVDSGEKIVQQRLDSIVAENSRLEAVNRIREEENVTLKQKLRSRDSIPEKIRIQYQTIYEKNKTLPANALALEFERLFARNHVDQR